MTNNIFTFKSEDEIILAAKDIIDKQLNLAISDNKFCDPQSVSNYLILNFKQQKHEQFGAIFLNSANKIIKDEILFNGSINSAQVYPRTVAQKALKYNAAAIVFYHNHFTNTEPSESDKNLTTVLIKTLKLIDVKVLDHFIVCGKNTFSFASHQLI